MNATEKAALIDELIRGNPNNTIRDYLELKAEIQSITKASDKIAERVNQDKLVSLNKRF